MEVTVDHIARALINWCDTESPTLSQFRNNKGEWENWAYHQFLEYLNKNEHEVEVCIPEPVFITNNKYYNNLIFNPRANDPKNRIMAEWTCESSENRKDFEEYVQKNIEKLSSENLKNDYKETTKFIISIYFDSETRNKLRNIEFIEVFNNFEIGCAMKRVK